MRRSARVVVIVVLTQSLFAALWVFALAGPKATLGAVGAFVACVNGGFAGAVVLAKAGQWLAPRYLWAVEWWRQRRLAAAFAAVRASSSALASTEPPARVATYRVSAAPVAEIDPVTEGKLASDRYARRLEIGLLAFILAAVLVTFGALIDVRVGAAFALTLVVAVAARARRFRRAAR